VFFERFREATARLPDGLIRPAPPAPTDARERAELSLGFALPSEFASFLGSFDGADLFHEAIVIAGVGPAAPRSLLELNEGGPTDAGARGTEELVFAEAVAGDRFALDARGRVWRLRAGSEERILAGSTFGLWLDATVARERLLYGPDGEFAPDVFEDDGEEVAPAVVLRQAERALKVDAGSAESQHDRGVALRRLGRAERAIEAFARATELDPENPWPWFDLGRTALTAGLELPRAHAAFRRAAELENGPSGARLLAWAARAALDAGDEPGAREARAEALLRDPQMVEALLRAEAQAGLEGDDEARAESEALRVALAPDSKPRRSLPVVTVREVAARPRPQARPPRPAPAGRPRSVASPGARRPKR
jgi:tetratricopeptide (TPR) repeat protein